MFIEKILAVAVGGGIGAALRYIITCIANLHGGITFPYGTVLVNVVGSFTIGLLMMYFQSRLELSPLIKLFIITGILGGFTTFSTFNMELLTFIRASQAGLALLYGGLNIIGAFICCWLGIVAGELLW
ncbi:MAG: fluoride efflux transporter CrcB [Megasphaera sp.]|jgi:CrcB protein|nr:fluoride efflux transporter CrcB [Megasphaera sp.]MCH4188296.1 fluoride efflux transporter CrcB [Megasphaera sp.]MCH4218405.1 fluoride efflux transporter CrcB [Megasphaera sp.]